MSFLGNMSKAMMVKVRLDSSDGSQSLVPSSSSTKFASYRSSNLCILFNLSSCSLCQHILLLVFVPTIIFSRRQMLALVAFSFLSVFARYVRNVMKVYLLCVSEHNGCFSSPDTRFKSCNVLTLLMSYYLGWCFRHLYCCYTCYPN